MRGEELHVKERFAMGLFSLSILVGAVLGMRLKVLILIPAIGLFVAGIALAGTVRGYDLSSIVSSMILAATCLQLGYLAGCATRFVMAATRTATPRRGNHPAKELQQQGMRP